MVHQFDQGDGKSRKEKIFRHLDPDVAAADNHCVFWPVFLDEILDSVSVGNVPQCEYASVFTSSDIRHNGHGAHRQDQLVIGFVIGFTRFYIPHGDRLLHGLDRNHFA